MSGLTKAQRAEIAKIIAGNLGFRMALHMAAPATYVENLRDLSAALAEEIADYLGRAALSSEPRK